MSNQFSSENQRKRLRKRWGDPIERFWNKVEKSGPDDCWIWNGVLDKNGYGRQLFEGKQRFAHRIAFKLQAGSINDALDVLHTCDNPPCCNPKHLFQGDAKANMIDCKSKGRMARGINLSENLNEEFVRFIRIVVKEGLGSYREIGNYFGVSIPTIYDIVHFRTWSHVT